MGTVYAKASDRDNNILGLSSPVQETLKKEASQSSPEEVKINLSGIQARVDKINVDGLIRTKDDIIQDTVKELFAAKDFQDVINKAHRIRGQLDDLGCFRNIGVFIDTSKGPSATQHGLEVTFHVKELSRIIGVVNTLVGDNEGSLVVGAKLPNILGRGEKLATEYSYGNKKTSSFSAILSKPLGGRFSPTISSSVFQASSDWPSSGYRQIDRGVTLGFGFDSSHKVKHSIHWEGVWRDLSTLSRSAAFEVREQSGPSLKSCLKYVGKVDTRDDAIFPTGGTLVQLSSEIAGLGGNVGFVKNDLLLQCNWSLFNDCVLQAAVQGGALGRIDKNKSVYLSDQFYLGGPFSLRGFQMRGVGPHSDGFSLGSDMYWAGALHLYTPLPFHPGQGGFGDLFRTHFFCNLGNIGNFNLDGDYANNLRQLRHQLRLAYGLGIALRLGQSARIELNYCFPVSYSKGDIMNSGIQFGIGIQFL